MKPSSVIVGLSGASGIPYALRLIECLVQANLEIHLVISQAAQVVAALESEPGLARVGQLKEWIVDRYHPAEPDKIHLWGHQEWTSPLASGSHQIPAMVICPCSSGCIAAIAHGLSQNLLERAADVMIKEKRQLILVPRETPLSVIHLENLLALAKVGATILPASPGFYHKPEKIEDLIDFIVARILDQLSVPHTLVKRWGA